MHPTIGLQAGNDLDALRAFAVAGRGDGLRLASAFRFNARSRDALAHQVVLHGVGTAFRKLLIVFIAAQSVGVTGDENRFVLRTAKPSCKVVQQCPAFGLEYSASAEKLMLCGAILDGAGAGATAGFWGGAAATILGAGASTFRTTGSQDATARVGVQSLLRQQRPVGGLVTMLFP